VQARVRSKDRELAVSLLDGTGKKFIAGLPMNPDELVR